MYCVLLRDHIVYKFPKTFSDPENNSQVFQRFTSLQTDDFIIIINNQLTAVKEDISCKIERNHIALLTDNIL